MKKILFISVFCLLGGLISKPAQAESRPPLGQVGNKLTELKEIHQAYCHLYNEGYSPIQSINAYTLVINQKVQGDEKRAFHHEARQFNISVSKYQVFIAAITSNKAVTTTCPEYQSSHFIPEHPLQETFPEMY